MADTVKSLPWCELALAALEDVAGRNPGREGDVYEAIRWLSPSPIFEGQEGIRPEVFSHHCKELIWRYLQVGWDLEEMRTGTVAEALLGLRQAEMPMAPEMLALFCYCLRQILPAEADELLAPLDAGWLEARRPPGGWSDSIVDLRTAMRTLTRPSSPTTGGA